MLHKAVCISGALSSFGGQSYIALVRHVRLWWAGIAQLPPDVKGSPATTAAAVGAAPAGASASAEQRHAIGTMAH